MAFLIFIKYFLLKMYHFVGTSLFLKNLILYEFHNCSIDCRTLAFCVSVAAILLIPTTQLLPYDWTQVLSDFAVHPLVLIILVNSPENRSRKPRGGVEVHLYSFFNLGARGGGWPTPCLGRIIPGKDPIFIV
jgi:hypothetical protein